MEMNISLKHLIEECSAQFTSLNKQKLNNLNVLFNSLNIYSKVLHTISQLKKSQILEISSFSNPPAQIDTVLNFVMIIMNKFKENVQYDVTSIDGIQKYSFKQLGFATKKQLMRTHSFLDDLLNFDPRTLTEENLYLLSVYQDSIKETFDIQYVGQVSKGAEILLNWVNGLQEFYPQFEKKKDKINFDYPKISTLIKNIQLNLNQNEVILKKSKEDDDNGIEQLISKQLLNTFLKNPRICLFLTNCLLALSRQLNIKSWIEYGRPLTFWYELDELTFAQQMNELIQMHKYNQIQDISTQFMVAEQDSKDQQHLEVQQLEIGFDLLLMLREEELIQIQKLTFVYQSHKDFMRILDNLQYIQKVSLLSLTINSGMGNMVLIEENMTKKFKEFLQSQRNLIDFTVEAHLTQKNQLQNYLSVMECIEYPQNIKQLQILFHTVEIPVDDIILITHNLLNFTHLQKLNIKLGLEKYVGVEYPPFLDPLNQLKSLTSLKINFSFSPVLKICSNIMNVIQELNQLQEFELILQGHLQDQYVDSFNYLISKITCLKVNKLDIQINYYHKYKSKNVLKSIYKMKRLVVFNLNPRILKFIR